MIRYIKILFSLINISFKRYLENRANAFGTLLAALIQFSIIIIFISIVFNYTKQVNGWSQNEMLFLAAVYRITFGLFYMLAQRGITFLWEYIRLGNLDYLLTKPINSQFYITFRGTRPFEFVNILLGIALLSYILPKLGLTNNYFTYIVLLFNLSCGLIIFYSIYYMIATLSIWIINFYSLGSLYYIITNPLTFPTNIYGKTFTFFMTFVLPLGLVISTPVEIFLRHAYALIFFEILFAALFFYLSTRFWNFALKHYTSASS